MGSGTVGTEALRAGTTGGWRGFDGGARSRRLALVVAALAAILVAVSVAEITSTLSDLDRVGQPETVAHVAIWQTTSVAIWLALIPLLWWLTSRLRPPALRWPFAVTSHLLASFAVSLIHVAGMVVLRKLAYWAGGEAYIFANNLPGELLYEYRKDAATYVQLVAFAAFAQWWLGQPDSRAIDDRERPVLRVTDGAVTHCVPMGEIAWAASAGNYVEIGWGDRRLLHRATLTALAEELGLGCVRIHRSRIVRRDAIRRVETERSGDFTVTLASGESLRGSRRYRDQL